MDVSDYLRFVASIKGIAKKDIGRRVNSALERTSSQDVRNTLIGKLSKGYRQRVGLAQALIHNPEVLILDEPTSGLDPKQIIEVRRLVKSLAGEHTIVLSTHILPEVSSTCSRVIIINDGRIEASDTPENLTAQLQGANAIVLDVEGPQESVQSRLASEPGVRRVSQDSESGDRTLWRVEVEKDVEMPRRLASAVVDSGWGLYSMTPLGLSLEDIFLKLTSDEEPSQPEDAGAHEEQDAEAAEDQEEAAEA